MPGAAEAMGVNPGLPSEQMTSGPLGGLSGSPLKLSDQWALWICPVKLCRLLFCPERQRSHTTVILDSRAGLLVPLRKGESRTLSVPGP